MMEMKMQQCLDRGDWASMVSLLRTEGLGQCTMTRLHLLVTTELISKRFARVRLVLRSLEQLSENTGDLQALLSSGLSSKLLLWFESIYNQLTSDLHLNAALMNLTEAFYDYFLVLAQPFIPVRELSVILMHLSRAALEPNIDFRLRLEAIRTFNSLLESVNRDQRRAIQTHHHKSHSLSEMAAGIFSAGDYELQVSLSEALCRLTAKKDRPVRASQWFSPELSHAFCDIRDADFEVDCRRFLNFLNTHHGTQQRVYTFPCLRAFINSTQLFRPQDKNLDKFWVDFNLGSECVSFFVDNPNGFLWGSIHLLRNEVNSYSLTEVTGAESLLVVDMINPIIHEEVRGHRVELAFRVELHSQISTVIGRVFKKPSGWPSSVQTYYCKKIPKKTQLRVLPLSSPSSDEDSVVKSSERSRAEILFDQIKQSTPIYKSGILVEEAGLHVSHDQEKETVNILTNEVVSCNWKRPFLDSGYLSDPTEATPTQRRRVEPAVMEKESREKGTELVSEEVEPVRVRLEWSAEGAELQTGESGEAAQSLVPDQPEEQNSEGAQLSSDIKAAFKNFTSQVQQQFRSHWQQVESEVLKSQGERQRHVSKLLSAVQQHREIQLQGLENSVFQQLKEFTSIHSSIMTFFEAENQSLSSFCQQLLLRLNSMNESKAEKEVKISDSQ